MNRALDESKAKLRQEMRARLANLPEQDRTQKSAMAVSLLREQTAWRKAQSVLLYAPVKSELDVWPLVEEALAEGKVISLPRFDEANSGYVACRVADLKTDLQTGRYGIREPGQRCEKVALNRLDFILVPGVAFDLHGHRLGRGKGHYDRILTTMRGRKCGVAFDEQIVCQVPIMPHDSDVNCILTPTRWIEL
ncbi:MAG TPA: 5-formyltetrahydrofolate cyclo-ligase [Patescibacteria group bacterium]|nr:5-formyltetrahydrofolate cyclo-ligase [Patescibacteria group bacterium]